MAGFPGDPAARDQLLRWYRAGLVAVDPDGATAAAIIAAAPPPRAPALLAVGKAASGMLQGALRGLRHHALAPSRMLVVTDRPAPGLPADATVLLGDHPVPAGRSFDAAARLGDWIATLDAGEPVIVLLSGGTSALLAAPLDGITPSDLECTFGELHALGLDIVAMNALRRRLTRWSGGRLAEALGSRPIAAYVISDVPGNLLGAIGSGPLIGGELHADTIARLLAAPERLARLPRPVIDALAVGVPPAPPVRHVVVADAQTMLTAIARAATDEGAAVVHTRERLSNDSAACVETVRTAIRQEIRRRTMTRSPNVLTMMQPPTPLLLLWGAEMTVDLPPGHGVGGRLQHFALELSVALEQEASRDARVAGPLVLAATSDGRDGPTDAAAAFAAAGLPDRLRTNGDDPARCLAQRDTHAALDRAGALVRTGPTGTNVADVVLALLQSWY